MLKQVFKNKLVVNSSLSYVYSGIGLLSSILIVPLLLDYLGEEKYGIWVSLYSIFAWLALLDGGFGNSLRNELAKNLKEKDYLEARKTITTSYVSVAIFLIAVILFFIVANLFIPWSSIFDSTNIDIALFVGFIFSFFILQMIAKLITKVLFAFNMARYGFLIHAVSNVLILASIYVLTSIYPNLGLWLVGIIFSITPILVFLLFSVWFFVFTKPQFSPKFKYYEKSKLKELTSKGSKFFIIEINFAFIQASMPFLISYYFSANDTTDYYVSLRYYSVVMVLLNIILQNLWTPITKAMVVKDGYLLRKYLEYKKIIVLTFTFILIMMLLASNFIYSVWLGDEMQIPYFVNILNVLFVFALVNYKSFANFLSAVNELKTLMKIATLNLLLFLPITYICVRILNFGLKELILIPTIILLLQTVIIYRTLKTIFQKIV